MVQKAKQVRLIKKAKKVEGSEEFPGGKVADATPLDPADNICVVNARELRIRPIYPSIQPKVPNLSHGLDRVLFNPGVYHLQDPRSKVYNFDPYLQKIMEVSEFDFDALKEYTTSSRDQSLKEIATALGKKYVGSSSSMTSALGHFHFLLSQWRPVNADALSQGFPETLRSFTILQRKPSAILLRYRDGGYAIDADKEFDTANILSMLGKSMEKLLTLPTDDYERYRRSSQGVITKEERTAPEAFHYCSSGDFLMRSQLDAQDPRLPGTGIFDVKTRAVVSIRMDAQNYEEGRGYEIKHRHGEWESFEREYFDMIRAAFLKYSLQVRMGRMDGIFVAFHNTQRIFGFQYISLPEMDSTIHGDWNTTLGDQEFKISLEMLNQVLNRATAKYPEQTLRIHFETRETKTPFMYIFVEPVTEAQADEIQTSNREKVEEFERNVLGRGVTPDEGQLHVEVDQPLADWEDIRATVEDELTNDELAPNAQADVAAEDLTNATITSDGSYPDEITESGVRDNIAAAPKSLDRVMAGTEPHRTADGRHTSDVEKVGLGTPSIDDETEVDSVAKSGVSANTGKANEDSRKPADVRFLDTVESEHQEAQAREDVLAMTLTIRNKVNGAYVIRPENLTDADKWSVEYSLDEISPDSRARNLYHACQQRRRKAFEATDFEDEDLENNFYIQRLRDMSRAGQIWRAKQDRAHPTQVFYRDPKPTSASDADSAMSSSDKRSGSGKKKLKKKKHDR